MEFECVRKSKNESTRGLLYTVRFRSKEGHVLVLQDVSPSFCEGYMIGSKITVDIKNPQKTLKET